MSDLISREFLQTAIHNFFNGLNHTPTEEDIQRYIEVAPSVENKGEWHDDGFCGDYVCSVCNQEFDSDIVNMRGFDFDLPKFCPNCGARMKGSAI